jgi:hypothetical protein
MARHERTDITRAEQLKGLIKLSEDQLLFYSDLMFVENLKKADYIQELCLIESGERR